MFARGLVHMATEVDLNRWRDAGKEIGRKVGIVEERKRILNILDNIQTMFNDCVDSPQKELMNGILGQVTDYLRNEIKGEIE